MLHAETFNIFLEENMIFLELVLLKGMILEYMNRMLIQLLNSLQQEDFI